MTSFRALAAIAVLAAACNAPDALEGTAGGRPAFTPGGTIYIGDGVIIMSQQSAEDACVKYLHNTLPGSDSTPTLAFVPLGARQLGSQEIIPSEAIAAGMGHTGDFSARFWEGADATESNWFGTITLHLETDADISATFDMTATMGKLSGRFRATPCGP
jgi:hypothetical protein